MNQKLSLCLLLVLISCGGQEKRTKKLDVEGTGQGSFIIMGLSNQEEVKAQAKNLNLKVEGESILTISGDVENIRELNIPENDQLQIIQDSVIQVSDNQEFQADQTALYQAKKDFGLMEFWKKNPTADGRGVIVGVLDDGISPHQSGFKTTTDGKRKFLKKGSRSSFSTFKMSEFEEHFMTTIDEAVRSFDREIDYNLDGKLTSWSAWVSKDGKEVCLDLNGNGTFAKDECKGTFSASQDYFALPNAPRYVLMTEVDLNEKTLQIFPAEIGDDSHGEGVASVLAGHKIGNVLGFDGVAPGAQILDYDLSEPTLNVNEEPYTIGTFIRGLEWLGKNGAEVTNISYSLFFTNVKAQTFMAGAIDSIVKKYNMVVSFSAGNNGPGLGSLNRRSMYPNSVLVAGAYVTPELDEKVHGVTGLPEEGRVVFYSSRGPGPGGVGPMLIAPLGSLTHSSPEGFTAFSGTSSASPALAGAATVLISALKQEGLTIDATTVVHALRLSGKQLKNEPFVAQGYGLPQVEKAIGIYKKLMNAETFMYINSAINEGSIDGVNPQAIFLKRSESYDVETRRISLGAASSTLARAEARLNLVVPVDLEYTKGIHGPKELWVSNSSRLFVDINLDEMLDGTNGEAFGEVRIKSKLDGTLMGIIPITVVDDQDVRKKVKATMKVSSHGAERLHLNATEGIKGFRVRMDLSDDNNSSLEVSVFDTNYVRTQYMKPQREFWVPTPKPGHYQVALNMNGGTGRPSEVQFEIEALNVNMPTTSAKAEDPRLTIKNKAFSPINGIIYLSEVKKPLATAIFDGKLQDNKLIAPEISLKVKKGTYYATLESTQDYYMSYLYSNCFTKIDYPNGQSETLSKSTIVIKEEDGEVQLTFRCIPFDWGLVQEDFSWMLKVTDKPQTIAGRIDIAGRGAEELRLPKAAPGTYEVSISDVNSSASIYLGTIDLY